MRPTPRKALSASAGLSVLFLLVYGGCNAITSLRSAVGSIFFQWERHLPFVPLMIVPYMSIDLFFVAAPFLCESERELWTLTKRIAATLLTAALCFLAFPLRFAFGRSAADGWVGAIYDWFRAMDAPFNQLPSLHIAFGALLFVAYARHTGGLLRIALGVWFALIAASAVLTYQHHSLDVVGGLALAGYCFYFIRETPPAKPVISQPRIGILYGIGSVLLFAGAIFFWPWGALLFWPALALGIVAAAYFGRGPGIFRKAGGVLPWSTVWALGPVLVGQHLSRIYYRRQCRAWDQVRPNLWIGSALREREARRAISEGVTAVLDVTAEFSAPQVFRALRYRNIQILDLTAPTPDQLEEMARFLAAETKRGVVYVHCKIGYSRSAAAVGAYLLRAGLASDAAEAIAQLRRVRPSIVVRPEVKRALEEFQRTRAEDFVLASDEATPL